MTNVTSPKPQTKDEEFKTGEQPTEKCGWGPGCPFCKSQEQKEEQGKMQPQRLSPKEKQQATRPKTLSLNMTKAKQQWEEEIERLNSKYNLDCYSNSELDSESDEGEQYCYEHGYETLIWKNQEWICQAKFCKNIIFKNQLDGWIFEI